MNAGAHAVATAGAHAICAESVGAKRREGTGPHSTAPNGVFGGWSPEHHIVQLGDVAFQIGMVTISKFLKDGHEERQVRDGLTPCWEYAGYRDAAGYGRVKGTAAHRLALMLVGVEIPDGHHVMHACDNPPCINPEHLTPGTRSENMRDMVAKGRHRYPTGDNHHSSLLTDEQIVTMRNGYTGRRGEITQLAREHGITPQQASRIIHGVQRRAAGGTIHPKQWRSGGWKA